MRKVCGVPLALVLVAVVLAGCAAGGGSSSAGSSPATGGPRPTGRTVIRPGLYQLGEGRVRAVGTLRHVQLEGGFWAVAAAAPGSVTGSTPNVALVLGIEKLGLDPASFDGDYVAVVGTVHGGVSVAAAGPEIDAESIQRLSDQQKP